MLQCDMNLSTGSPTSYSTEARRGHVTGALPPAGLTRLCRIASNTAPPRRQGSKLRWIGRRNLFASGPWLRRGGLRARIGGHAGEVARLIEPMPSTGRRRSSPTGHSYVNQTYLSAFQSEACTHARVPGPHEVPRRPCGDRSPPRQGPQASRRLNPPARAPCAPTRWAIPQHVSPAPVFRAAGGCSGRRNSRQCRPRLASIRCARTPSGSR